MPELRSRQGYMAMAVDYAIAPYGQLRVFQIARRFSFSLEMRMGNMLG